MRGNLGLSLTMNRRVHDAYVWRLQDSISCCELASNTGMMEFVLTSSYQSCTRITIKIDDLLQFRNIQGL